MRIAQVNGERGFSGGEVQLFYLLDFLAKSSDECILLGRTGSAAVAEARAAGLETHELPMRNGADVVSMLAMRSLLKRLDVDVVHMHTHRAHVVGAFAASGLRRPAKIVTRRMDYPIPKTPVHRLLYGKLVDAVVAISEAVKRELLRTGLPEEQIVSIPSGVDVERFQPVADSPSARARSRTALGLPQDAIVVGSTAHLHPRKGLDVLIRAFARLRKRHGNLHLAIAGSGGAEADLRELTRALGLEPDVTFLGQLGDVGELLRALDIFCLPSRKEGLGVSVLEAMAAALPVVASRVGGLTESVQDEHTGLLVGPDAVDELEVALDRLASRPELRTDYGRRGRQRVCERYSATAMAGSNRELYLELIARRRGGNAAARTGTRT